MPRGRAFTPMEDCIIRAVFGTYESQRARMDRMAARIPDPANRRRYSSYVNRWRVIRNRNPIISRTTHNTNDDDSDSSDSDDDDPFSPSFTVQRRILPPPVQVPAEPVSLKRTIDQMCEDELAKYEVEINEKIKRRKEEIEKEKKSNPECPLCLEDIKTNCVVASCGHVFCTECYCKNLSRPLQRYSDVCHKCPTCRTNWDKPDKVHFINSENITVSACKEKGAKISV